MGTGCLQSGAEASIPAAVAEKRFNPSNLPPPAILGIKPAFFFFFLLFTSSCAGTGLGGTWSGLERDVLCLAEHAGSGRLHSSGRFQLLHKLRLHAKCITLYNN